MATASTDATARFLADRHRLFAYIHALVRSPHAAEDLFQDVYLALARALEQGEAIADQAAWCRGVARNLALRRWRDDRRQREVPAADLLDRIDRAFAENAGEDLGALHAALAACRDGLADGPRRLLDLKYAEDLSVQTIAERTGRTARGVITALARIRQRLMDCITARLRSPGHG